MKENREVSPNGNCRSCLRQNVITKHSRGFIEIRIVVVDITNCRLQFGTLFTWVSDVEVNFVSIFLFINGLYFLGLSYPFPGKTKFKTPLEFVTSFPSFLFLHYLIN